MGIAAIEKARLERIAAAEKAERERIAAAEKAERERLAALEKARLERLAAYKARCEGDAASDDPFVSFNATQQGPRMDLVLDLGKKNNGEEDFITKMKLQATKNRNCMWLGNAGRPDLVPTLITENIFQQNPKNTSQYVLNINGSGVTSIVRGKTFLINSQGRFVLDFEEYQCLFQKTDGAKMVIACNDD